MPLAINMSSSSVTPSSHSPWSHLPAGISHADSEILRECAELCEGKSPVERSRALFHPRVPIVLAGGCNGIQMSHGETTTAEANAEQIAKLFPHTYGRRTVHFNAGTPLSSHSKTASNASHASHASHASQSTNDDDSVPLAGQPLRIGIVLSGGPAPGGHNVIAGVWDYIQSISPQSVLIGFRDGPSGLIDNQFIQVNDRLVDAFRSSGGFHMLGSGRTKVESLQQFAAVKRTVEQHKLDGLCVVGGDDSNTNAGQIAEYLLAQRSSCCVCGVPKTIDGDLKNEHIEVSFGFDTCTKVYSEQVGALAADAVSARKTWHFCRLMGRSASHVTLEVALQTHPNVVLIGEDLRARNVTLTQVTSHVCDVIARRAQAGLNYGVLILPEGIIEFLPDVNALMQELNELAASSKDGLTLRNVPPQLSTASRALFESLPVAISEQLLMDRDDHGNVQVAKIESERLLASLVETELKRRRAAKQYIGKLSIVTHFIGYEGRANLPSNFDAEYCYTLGTVAAALIQHKQSGMMATARLLHKPTEMWQLAGIPITSLMNLERRSGKMKPVIKKALVELQGRPFLLLNALRPGWQVCDSFRQPGPLQFGGLHADTRCLTLQIEQWGKREMQKYTREIQESRQRNATQRQSKL